MGHRIPSLEKALNQISESGYPLLRRCTLFSEDSDGCKMNRGGQPMTWQKSRKIWTNGPARVDASRPPKWVHEIPLRWCGSLLQSVALLHFKSPFTWFSKLLIRGRSPAIYRSRFPFWAHCAVDRQQKSGLNGCRNGTELVSQNGFAETIFSMCIHRLFCAESCR